MKTGIIDVGGGLRGIYAYGVWDYCLDEKIPLDFAIGISAGSANLTSYLAGQKGRNYKFYTEYPFRRQYMGLGSFIVHHSFLNLDYVYETLSNSDGENPLDYEKLAENKMEWLIAACDAKTGETKYFDKNDISADNYAILKASSAIPFICHPYKVHDTKYFDGALGDTIPVQKAFDCGCDKVILILTKPADTIRSSKKDIKLASHIKRKYPLAAQRLCDRAKRYNDGVKYAKKLAAEGKVLIIAPDDTCGVDTLTKDAEAMEKLYQKGRHDAEKIKEFLSI